MRYPNVVLWLAAVGLLVLPQDLRAQAPVQRAAAAFEAGQTAQERSDTTGAIRHYTDAITFDPSLFQAYYQRAVALMSLGRDREAEQDLRKVVELKPEFARASRGLGPIYLDSGRTEEAKQAFARAQELDPKRTGVRVSYASALLKSNDPAAALTHLRAAVEAGEANALAFALLGVALERSGQLDEAFDSYSRAIQMQPGYATALEGRARIHEKRGHLEKAIADYSAAYYAHPARDLAAHLASLHTRANQPQAAIGIYRLLLNEKPDDLPVKVEMIRLMAQMGQKEEAAREIERLVTGQPSNGKVLMMAGDLYLAEQPEQAASYYERALKSEPTNNRARVQLGASLIRATQYEPALTHLSEAVRLEPDDYTARAHLATALFKLKNYAPAAGAFLWLINSKPDVAVSYYFLAISLDRLGDCEQSLRAYQEFVRRADANLNQNEIEEANIRIGLLQKLAKAGKCKSPAKGRTK